MAKRKLETVGEILYWSYANLAMAHMAVESGKEKYGVPNYVVRAKLFKGLKDGSMRMGTIFADEKVKLRTGQFCNYCGSPENLALDHVLPQKRGGQDLADNLIYACRRCNSSKGKKDLLEWMGSHGEFLPLLVVRRYLKLAFAYCVEKDLLEKKMEDLIGVELPFRLDLLPSSFPKPNTLVLNVVPAEGGVDRD